MFDIHLDRVPSPTLRMRLRRGGAALAPLLALGLAACADLTGLNDAFGAQLLGIDMTASATNMAIGDTVNAKASGRLGGVIGMLSYDRLLDATWRVSDPAVASLTAVPIPASDSVSVAQVLVVGRAPGVVTVTASARGHQGAVTITVWAP